MVGRLRTEVSGVLHVNLAGGGPQLGENLALVFAFPYRGDEVVPLVGADLR